MPDTARLFFALWPDDAVRAALAHLARSLRQECAGRMIPAHNIHLTLIFLGNVAKGRIPDLHALAAAIAAPPIDLTVDALEYWRHNRIVWAGAVECPQALRILVARLTRALPRAGFRCENRPYTPHITLLRDARRAPSAKATGGIVWRAGEFALVQSVHRNGAVAYEVIGYWPLAATL
jgi:2'-5' RNA ligase